MNAHRHLPKTLNILQRLEAVELLGYTKIGENTFPNTVPFVAGYSEKQLESICFNSTLDPQDHCPYIWKAFDNANYLTVQAEDAPYLGGFNYLKTGFVKKPTDFYLRPIMLAVMSHMPRPVKITYLILISPINNTLLEKYFINGLMCFRITTTLTALVVT